MPPVQEQVKDINRQIQGEANSALQTVANTPVPAPSIAPVNSTTVSTDELQGSLSPVSQPQPSFPSLAGLTTGAQNRLASTQAELGAEKTQNTAVTQRILSLQNELGGEAERQAQLEQEAQLGERRRRLSELTSGISTGLADLQAFDAETETALDQFRGQGNGVAANIIDRKNSERRRQRGLEKMQAAAALSRQVSAADLLSGELETAQANIDRAVELEFAPIRQEIETAKWLLERSDAGLERLTDAEKADYSNFIQANEALIEDKKATERDILAIADEAIRNGASQAEANQILASETPQQAQSVASPYIGLLDRQRTQSQLMTDQANRANIYDQMQQRKLAAAEAARQATTEAEQQKETRKAETESALELRTLAEQLKNMSGIDSAVGFGLRKSVWGGLPFTSGDAIAGTNRADFEATAERVANLLTLDNLDLMSGVLSETDIRILETAGSNLRNFNQSEEQYQQEIDRIISTMNRTIEQNGITEEQAAFWGILDDEDTETFNSIWQSL